MFYQDSCKRPDLGRQWSLGCRIEFPNAGAAKTVKGKEANAAPLNRIEEISISVHCESKVDLRYPADFTDALKFSRRGLNVIASESLLEPPPARVVAVFSFRPPGDDTIAWVGIRRGALKIKGLVARFKPFHGRRREADNT